MQSRSNATPRPARGSLSRDLILQTALRIADESGLEALSMRRLGQELGVEAMSLYNHVPNKAALLDGMVEVILDEMPAPGYGGSLTERLAETAWAFRHALQVHEGALPLFISRPAVTKGALRHVEAALGLLREAGFQPDEAISALNVLVTFVVGHTLSRQSRTPADEHEHSRPLYEELAGDEFPNLNEAVTQLATHNEDDEFAFGLDALLIGLRKKAKPVRPTAR
ncbi:MAG: TetR/AcrR family transcriptional regulator C-terminal domain-containing protein [Byssovorax sp.]